MKKVIIIILFIIYIPTTGYTITVNERLDCAVQAVLKYGIPVDILLAISSIENGNIDTIRKNTNGSYDYGAMQINSIYIQELKERYNIEVDMNLLISNLCYNFDIAAFKIKEHIKNDNGDFLKKIANYHSYTPELNKYYQSKIILHSDSWRKLLHTNNIDTYLWSEQDLKD